MMSSEITANRGLIKFGGSIKCRNYEDVQDFIRNTVFEATENGASPSDIAAFLGSLNISFYDYVDEDEDPLSAEPELSLNEYKEENWSDIVDEILNGD